MSLPDNWPTNTFQQIAEWGEVETERIEVASIDELKEKLTRLVAWLIDNQPEKLMYSLYRVDVNETESKKVLSDPSVPDPASRIAEMLIARQKTKDEFKAAHPVPRPSSEDEDLLL